ncbi:MAG: hypothetical protein OEP52_00465, partial [Acidimicrobiia bacterium]|nr:hypothetical protein [Acidimicrobiia bacterium]
FRHEPTAEVRISAAILRFSVIPVILTYGFTQASWVLLALPLVVFTAAALVAHGRLMLNRPEPSGLTEFYLWISIGGAAGGVFAALLAPVLFDQILEYPIAIALAVTLLPITTSMERRARGLAVVAAGVALVAGAVRIVGQVDAALVLAAVAAVIAFVAFRKTAAFIIVMVVVIVGSLSGAKGTLATARTFFGVHRVFEADPETHVIASGTTVHGLQIFGSGSPVPTGYYHLEGPVGEALATLDDRPTLDVALLGLGAGTLAAYSRPGDVFTFFEIDPAVVGLATNPDLFTYVSEAAGSIEFVLGDGRIMLERQDEQYDTIVMDAFGSDSIPTHLLTREAIDVYLEHLRTNGLLLIHISNRHLDLEPVLGRLADDAGLAARVRRHTPSPGALEEGAAPSTWVAFARSAEDLDGLTSQWQAARVDGPLWTDSYTSLLGVFRWR